MFIIPYYSISISAYWNAHTHTVRSGASVSTLSCAHRQISSEQASRMKSVNERSKSLIVRDPESDGDLAQRWQKRFCSRLFVLKILHFLAGLSGTSWGRYAAIYYVSRGLTPFQIGSIGCTIPFVRLVAQPLWGVIADKLRGRKCVYLVTTTLNTASILSLSILK